MTDYVSPPLRGIPSRPLKKGSAAYAKIRLKKVIQKSSVLRFRPQSDPLKEVFFSFITPRPSGPLIHEQ